MQTIRGSSVPVICLSILLLSLLVGVVTLGITGPLFARPSLALSKIDDRRRAHELGHIVEQQMQQWQQNLFLETYSATYSIGDENDAALSLTGEIHLHFVGRREDLWGRWLSRYNSNHMIADITIDVERGELVEFSYSHGEPFGYDKPLAVMEWSVGERELIKICDDFGGKEFREQHKVALAYVHATATRPGRYWTLAYSQDSTFFECTVNIDTGSIQVKSEERDWQEVGNLSRIK